MSAEQDALRARTRLIRATEEEIRNLLKQAGDEVAGVLAAQPSDYQQWYLPQLQAQIDATLKRWGGEAADAAGNGQRAAWREGSSMVDTLIDASAKEVGTTLRAVLPVLDDAQLRAMTSFLTSKISKVTVAAADAINTDLGMVIMGAKSPWDAIKGVQATLGEATTKRAGTIVRTELARAYSTASEGRMQQWSKNVPGLQKEWLKSNKLHPRQHHALMHGQLQPVDQPFRLPGGGEIMHPHHPEAPASETINCGCVSVPRLPAYKSKAQAEDDNRVPLSQVKMGPPSSPAAQPQAETPPPGLRRAMRELRRELGPLRHEVAVFLDQDGREVFRKRGNRNSVRFTADEVKQVKGTVHLHNHPSVTSFSDADVRFAMSHQLAELHVVDKVFHYTMRPPSGGWNKTLWDVSVSRVYRDEVRQARARFDAALRSGQISEAQYSANFYDVVWEAVAARTGLRYKRRFRGKSEY